MMPTFENSAPSWSPDFIYSQQERIQPYNNEQFLNQIFNFNNQSITAFQSLPHQLKLKFFLSVEEMKLLGYMNDKQGYQYILQQIARRRALITKVPAKQVQQKKVQQTIEWGEKLEHLCQDHLKKIQKDNFLDDIPIQYTINHHQTKQLDFLTGETIANSSKKTIQENEQDEFEWAQTGSKTSNMVSYNENQVQPFSTAQVTATQNVKQTNNNDDQQFGQFCQENVSGGEGNRDNGNQGGGNWNGNGGFQGGYGSYAVESPKRQEVVKMQHIDVWDLEVLQQQSPKKVIEKVLSSKIIPAPPSPKKIPSYTSISSSKNVEQEVKANHEQIFSQNSIKAHQVQLFQNGSSHNANGTNFYGNSSPGGSEVARSYGDLNYLDGFSFQPQPTQSQIQQDNFHHNQFQVQPTLKSQKSHKSEHSQSSHNQTPAINNPPSSPNIQNSMSFQYKNTVTPVSYDIDFNFLGPSTSSHNIDQTVQTSNRHGSPFESSYNSNIHNSFDVSVPNTYQQSTSQNPMSKSQPLDTSFGLDLSVLDNEIVFSNFNTSLTNQPNTQFFKKKFAKAPQQQYFQSQQQIDQNQDTPANLLTTIDTSLLQPLLVRPQTKTLQSFLNKKLFDFDRKFYKEALNLLQVLGYKDNPDYSYIKDQRDICAEIYRLTEMFSAAVDQDREEEVKESLKKTKLLYKSLDAKKTTMLVKKYMKLEGKSLQYQIGKLSLQAGVPKDLLAKAILSRKNSKVSFSEVSTLLYLMSYFGSTYNIAVFTCHVTDYVDKIVQEMQTLAAQLSTFDPTLVQVIKNNQKFIDYKQNIRKILILTQRIITLSSYCNKDKLLPQTLSLAQKLPQPSSSSLLPSHIPTFFTNLAENNCINIYTLHSQMNQFMNLHPLCCLCLQSVEELGGGQNGGAKRDDHRFYHFFCYNFRNKVAKWKEDTMKVSFVEISSQGNELKIQNSLQKQPQTKLDQNIGNAEAESIEAVYGNEKKEEETKNEQTNIEIKTENTEQKMDPFTWPEPMQLKNIQIPSALTTKVEKFHNQPFSVIQLNDTKNGNGVVNGFYGDNMMMADEGHAWQFQQSNHIESTHHADIPISLGQNNGVGDDEDQWQQAEVIGDA